jgi:hypothetical protein
MKRFSSLGVFMVPVIIALLIILPLFAHQTRPTEVGIRIIKWSLFAKRGMSPHIYQPGATYFFPPIINGWHTFDTKLQNMEMTVAERGVRMGGMIWCLRPLTEMISRWM